MKRFVLELAATVVTTAVTAAIANHCDCGKKKKKKKKKDYIDADITDIINILPRR